jgi:hypothetical protein
VEAIEASAVLVSEMMLVRTDHPFDALIVLVAGLVLAASDAVFAGRRVPELIGMLWIWALHAMIGAVLVAPFVVFGHKRVHLIGPLHNLAHNLRMSKEWWYECED